MYTIVAAGDVKHQPTNNIINRTQTMKLNIKLSCIAQHKEPTLNIANNTYALFKQDALRRSAQTSCDVELADGLYSVDVAYGEAVNTSYVYVNKGKAISVDVPAYVLNCTPTDKVTGCALDLTVEVIDLVNKKMYVRTYSRSLALTLEDMQLADGLYSVAVTTGTIMSPTILRAHIIRVQSGNVSYLTLTHLH